MQHPDIKLILPTPKATCGTCRYHQSTPDLTQVICKGVPPTPCIIGGQQTVAGMSYQVELMSPHMARSAPGCALHRHADGEGKLVQ